MRILHCADLHIGSSLESGLLPERAALRRREINDSISRIAQMARRHRIDVCLIAGDLFDTDLVPPDLWRRCLSAMAAATPVRFLILPGNHDGQFLHAKEERAMSGDPADRLPGNVKILTGGHSVRMRQTQIFAAETADDIRYIRADLRLYNILLMHGTVSGQTFTFADGTSVPFSALRNRNLDYGALGHVHAAGAAQVDSRLTLCWPGCLEARGFDEPGKKGFIVFNTENGSRRFVRAALRECVPVRVDLTSEDTEGDILNKVHQALTDVPEEDLIFVHLEGEASADEFHAPGLQKLLLQEYFGVRVDTSHLKMISSTALNDAFDGAGPDKAAPESLDPDATRIWDPQEQAKLSEEADDWTKEERPLARKRIQEAAHDLEDVVPVLSLRELYKEAVKDSNLPAATAQKVLQAGLAALDGEELPL